MYVRFHIGQDCIKKNLYESAVRLLTVIHVIINGVER